ncbi:MAG TPA: hypothetical protein VFL60_05570 [Gaiellaceae bacterium]|nr:hypothetical protein [Gaiellaceae bacterium]
MHLLALAAVLLGLHGNPGRFQGQTGQQTQIRHTFVSFAQTASLGKIVADAGPVPMLALNTGSYGSHETATPRGIALGRNDAFLIRLNGVVNDWSGDRFYVRPFPEMNAWWEANSAYNRNGTPRGGAHTTAWNRKALARIAIILRGGAEGDVDRKLAKLGLPGIHQDLAITTPKLRIVWNPQGFGAPDVPGNSAQAYYPGDAYVDVVGDDLYDIRGHGATWKAAEALYRAHPGKAFAFPEWGLWGFDDPQFVRDMAKWVRTHRRTEFIAYFAGKPGSVWDLATKPRSRAAYRSLITPLG